MMKRSQLAFFGWGGLLVLALIFILHQFNVYQKENAPYVEQPDSLILVNKAMELENTTPRLLENRECVYGEHLEDVSVEKYESMHFAVDNYGYNSLLTEEERLLYNQIDSTVKYLWDKSAHSGQAATLPTNMTEDIQAQRLWKIYQIDHPQSFYIMADTGKMPGYDEILLVFSYRFAGEQEMWRRMWYYDEMNSIITECIEKVEETASDYEKVKSVYEWINNNLHSRLLLEEGVVRILDEQPEFASAKFFQLVMNVLGLDCVYMESDLYSETPKGWNCVNIDGSYYGIDVYSGNFLKGSSTFCEENGYRTNYFFTGYFPPEIADKDYSIKVSHGL